MMIDVQKALYERDSQKYEELSFAFVEKYPTDELANFSLHMAYFVNNEIEKAKESN